MNRLVASIAAVTLAAACTSPRAPEIAKGGIALPFIENDYAQAITKARERNVPVFVEVWAPW
jgi:hypothetical protein